MFVNECPSCGLRELRGARSIEILVNSTPGIELVCRCRRCGTACLVDGTSQPAARGAVPVPTAA